MKAAVVAKRVNGGRITQIAKDLDITRPTVYKILEETNIDKMVEDGRLGAAKLVPKSLTAIESTLDKGDGYLGIKLLTGLGILGSEGKPAKPQAPQNLHLQIMNLVGRQNQEKTELHQNSAITVSNNSTAEPEPVESKDS